MDKAKNDGRAGVKLMAGSKLSSPVKLFPFFAFLISLSACGDIQNKQQITCKCNIKCTDPFRSEEYTKDISGDDIEKLSDECQSYARSYCKEQGFPTGLGYCSRK